MNESRCPYCHCVDCRDRAEHAAAYEALRAQDRAAFEHFTRRLPIKREAA